MLGIIKKIVAFATAVALVYALITLIYNLPNAVLPLVLLALGVIMVVVGVLTNVQRKSRAKVGVINRAEFYGVIVVLLGFIYQMNVRIDSLFQIIASMK